MILKSKYLLILAAFLPVILCKDIVCPCEWQKIESGCYLFVKNRVTWDAARADCQKRGGDLALPSCFKENDGISSLIKSHGLHLPWIGLVRRFDHQFTTSCGEKPRYTAWKKGQPDFYHGEENCGHMLTGGDIGKWNDIRCDRNYDYICEIKYPRCG